MTSLQARRGPVATIYRVETVQDAMNNKVVRPHSRDPHHIRASMAPDRSARAEVPGQQQIDVVTLRVPADLDEVDIWSRVLWDGGWYDVVAPPADHHGARQVRHWTLTLRRRPDSGGLVG